MAGLETVDDASRIDAELKKCQELKDIVSDQRNTLRGLQLRSIEDFEVSLRNEQKFLLKEKKELSAKLVAKKGIVEEERKIVAGILSEKEDVKRMEVESLGSHLKRISTETPIFRDALTVYSMENLTKDIDEIRLDGRRVKEDIAVVDRTIGDLFSKYDFDATCSVGIPGKKSKFEELRDTTAILIESKSEIVWCKKSNKFLNGQLETNSTRNKRDIEYFQSTV